VDHSTLLDIIRRDIQDGRVVRLIEGLLKAGYMEDWRYYDTPSGTPQGGIISPLLFNVYLNDFDKWVEDTLIPAFTKGDRRKNNPEYDRIGKRIARARKKEDHELVNQLLQDRRKMMAVMPCDPDFRRLRFVRYADDFLLGFTGPKSEAEDIRDRLSEYLRTNLKLTLSMEKTLITHAADDKAKFLGYEIKTTREETLVSDNGMRATNGCITLLMPQKVVHAYRSRYCREGKISHRPELAADTDYTIVQRYQAVLVGVYNYWCMAVNVGKRMNRLKYILETSLLKTLANKHKCRVNTICDRYRTTVLGGDGSRTAFQVIVERPDKEPLIATFGGIPFKRVSEGLGPVDFNFGQAWGFAGNNRSEVVQRLVVGKCELCGAEGVPMEVHHIRKMADIDRPGRRPKAAWEKTMSARRRKTLVVCERCHKDITHGRHDGPSTR
jgi:hypothetical protein